MPNFNQVFLVGNLTRDLEMRYTPKGTAVAKCGIAINRKWKTESGEQKEEVSFFNIEVWGKSAEIMSQYAGKGSAILIQGRLKQDSWVDKETQAKRTSVSVVVESFQFLGSKPEGERGERPERQAWPERRQQAAATDSLNQGGGHDDNSPLEEDAPPF